MSTSVRIAERAAHAGSVATAEDRRVGRPVLAGPDRIARAVHLRDHGETIAEIVEKTGIPPASLCRHLPPRPIEALTADGGRGEQRSQAL